MQTLKQNLTPLKKQAYLDALAKLGNGSAAAQASGISRASAFLWEKKDPEFAKGIEQALEMYAEYLEGKADERATREKNPSDLLMIFRLKGLKPRMYNDKYRLEIESSGVNALAAIGASLLAAHAAKPREIEGTIEDLGSPSGAPGHDDTND